MTESPPSYKPTLHHRHFIDRLCIISRVQYSTCVGAPFAVMMVVVVDARGERKESAGSITLLRLADDDEDFFEAPMARDSAMTWGAERTREEISYESLRREIKRVREKENEFLMLER